VDELSPNPALAPRRKLISFVKDRPGHDRRYAMDFTKINRALDWSPRHSLDDGLRATVEWYLSHPEWVLAIHKQIEYQNWMDKNYDQRERTA
jgi:dTDP-glucose 4,6-dehydratase